MKRILYFTAIFLMLLPVLSEKGVVFAQNMSTEYYDLNYLWHQADETGYFSIQRCDICGEFVASDDPDAREGDMEKHRKRKHPELGNSNNNHDYTPGSTGDETGGGSSSGSGSSCNVEAIGIVNLSLVAYAMEHLGIISANRFVEGYDAFYRQYVGDRIYRAVLPAYIDAYIKRIYPLKRNVTLKTAIEYDYPFIMFARPSNSNDSYRIDGQEYVYYNVIYNKNFTEYSGSYYQNLYVFDDM